jgi:hypothetical protein
MSIDGCAALSKSPDVRRQWMGQLLLLTLALKTLKSSAMDVRRAESEYSFPPTLLLDGWRLVGLTSHCFGIAPLFRRTARETSC